MFLDEYFNVFSVYQHLPANLNEGELSIPYLASPKPFGDADDADQFLNGIESLLKKCMCWFGWHFPAESPCTDWSAQDLYSIDPVEYS